LFLPQQDLAHYHRHLSEIQMKTTAIRPDDLKVNQACSILCYAVTISIMNIMIISVGLDGRLRLHPLYLIDRGSKVPSMRQWLS
jgi:hypothetical protein